METNSSKSNRKESECIRRTEIEDSGQQGGPQKGGAPWDLDVHCISISSDSESSLKEKETSAVRISQCSGNSSSSSSRTGAQDKVLYLIDSGEDSDYKKDLLALEDSEDECSGSSRGSGRPCLSPQVSGVVAPPTGHAANGVSTEFDFPSIYSLFAEYNDRFFEGRLAHVEVKWSSRMTLCAGLCVYRTGGYCSVRLSAPLLRFRSVKELKETLLHEMIHAFLFVTEKNRSHNAHGPPFLALMKRLNEQTGLNITVYHNFHDEVNHYRRHVWRCEGPCRERPPYFGFIRRAMNRAPGPSDWWWAEHQQTCGGVYVKVSEPPKPVKEAKRQWKAATTSKEYSPSVSKASGSKSSSSSSKTKGFAGIKRHFFLEDEKVNPKRIKETKLERPPSDGDRKPSELAKVLDLEDTHEKTQSEGNSVHLEAAMSAQGRSASAVAAAEQRAAAAEKRARAAAAAAAAEAAHAVEAPSATITDASRQPHSNEGTRRHPAVSAPAKLAPCPRCNCLIDAATLRRHIQCCIRDHPLSLVPGGKSSPL